MQPKRVGRGGLQSGNGGQSRMRLGMLAVLLAGVALGAGLMPVQAGAQSARSWNGKGEKAEAREDYDAAF